MKIMLASTSPVYVDRQVALIFFPHMKTMWTSKGIGGKKKPCTDSSIGSCVRACVTDARATLYVCVHMPKEVYEKEKMCVHAAEDAGSSADFFLFFSQVYFDARTWS